MKAIAKWVKGMLFEASGTSEHIVSMDADTEFGGEDKGVRPMELFLFGLGGCTGMDVLSILKKMRKELESFEIKIEADRAENHPKVFTHIRLLYILKGKDLKEKDVEKAVNLSKERYCSAGVMLGKSAKLDYQFKILN